MANRKKISYAMWGIIFFLMMFLLNGILFPLTDEGITTQILIKSAITSLIGTLIFLGLIYLIRKYKLD